MDSSDFTSSLLEVGNELVVVVVVVEAAGVGGSGLFSLGSGEACCASCGAD